MGIVLLGGFEEIEFGVLEQLILTGDQGQVDLDGLLHRGIVKAFGYPFTVGLVGNFLADLGQVILAVGMLHMRQEFGAFAHQVSPASEQVAGGAPLRRIDIGLGQHAATPQGGNLLGIDLVMFGLAAVDGFHVKGMAEDEGNALLSAEVGEPIPGEEAFHGHDQPLPIGGDNLEEGFRSRFHVAV